MSDPLDPAERDPVELPAPPADWRGRFVSICEAAGLRPVAVACAGAVLLAVAGLVLAMVLRDQASPPLGDDLPFTRPPEAISTSTTEVAAPFVHVAGAVAAPGVYELEPGARIVDAIDAAGGAEPDADLSRVNLAAEVVDGQQVFVARPGEEPPLPPGPSGATDVAPAGGGLVDLNAATAAQLEELPGIGPALAAAIVAHRDEHGSFVAVESLVEVPGIGEAKLAALRDFATV